MFCISAQTNTENTLLYNEELDDFVSYEKEKVQFLLKWCGYALDKLYTNDDVNTDSMNDKEGGEGCGRWGGHR